MGKETKRCDLLFLYDGTTWCSQKSYQLIQNDSRNLRGVTTSFSVLNFGTFVHSTTLIHDLPILKQVALDRWDNIYFGDSFSRVNGSFSTAARLLVLSWAFSYSLTKLQNYSLCESLKYQKLKKKTTVTTKLTNKSF